MNTYDVISVPTALLLYVCNSVSLVSITYRVGIAAQKRRKLKVEDGKGPAEDPIPTEGGRKSCKAEKSGEKRNLQPKCHIKRESQRESHRRLEKASGTSSEGAREKSFGSLWLPSWVVGGYNMQFL